MINHFKKQGNFIICFMQGKVMLWGPSKFLTSFNLLALKISNPELWGAFSYTKFETIAPTKEYWVGMVR
jgi:hypothetical protein